MNVFLTLLLVSFTLVALYLKYMQDYWRRLGIPHERPKFPFGNLTGWRKTKHLIDIFTPVYEKYKGTGPFAGFYFMTSPAIITLDLDLIKNILIKDFNNFDSRGIFHNVDDDPLSGNLFRLDGSRWRSLRRRLTPTFTTGKMKFMYPTVSKVVDELVNVFAEKLDSAGNGALEITDLLARFTADVIGTCAFGLECSSLRNPNAEFVVMGKRAFTERRHSKLIDTFLESFPEIGRMFRMRLVAQHIHDFYMRIVRETVSFREEHGVKRNDFMDILIEMKNSDEGESKLTLKEIAAQSFVFFLAGYETSSTTIGFALFELAQNPDVQEKLRQEIKDVLKRHKGEFTYECLRDMKYLKQVIWETLRKYPVLPHLMRKAKNRYQTDNPRYSIDKGVLVIVPVYGIHYDRKIYPEPEKFDPDRFTEDKIKERHSCAWLPFGDGPRNCIGLRFGKMQVSIGLAHLIHNFKFSTCKESPTKFDFVFESQLLSAHNGIRLHVTRAEI